MAGESQKWNEESGSLSGSAVEEVQSKPSTEHFRPELTRLPEMTPRRKFFRFFVRTLARLLVFLFTKTEVKGLDHNSLESPALVVTNHLGDADAAVGVALLPREMDGLAKVELYDFPLLGWLMDWYGVIWVHRGLADRKALREALRGFEEGRMIAIAPEGRESLTGTLEEGMNGAAYLALKGNVPVIPITLTGTENKRVYGNMRRFKRTAVTLTVGQPFMLEHQGDFRESVRQGTATIMRTLAAQLPAQYRGIYQDERTGWE